MKPENERLGRCNSCRFWKSYSELLAERVGPSPSPSELDFARKKVKAELSPNNLDVGIAERRGWCTAAEKGGGTPSTILAINMVDHEVVRMITGGLFGCLCYQPRPRCVVSNPAPDFDGDERLGRCAGCNMWSDALNEANALFAQERLTNPFCSIKDAQREAMALLSPPPLDPETAMLRGWCKNASFLYPFSSSLVVDPGNGAVGGLITSRDHACTKFVPIMSPNRKTRPGWRLMAQAADRRHAALGPSASLDSLLCSYMDPATLIDPHHPLSPLHDEHPLNLNNAKNLSFNPVPAFAAYILNASAVNTLSDRQAIHQGQELGRKAGVEDRNRPRVSMLFSGDPSIVRDNPNVDVEEINRQMLAQARLAQDFSERTCHIGSVLSEPENPPVPSVRVNLSKEGDVLDTVSNDKVEGRQKSQNPRSVKKQYIVHGFTDRRRMLE